MAATVTRQVPVAHNLEWVAGDPFAITVTWTGATITAPVVTMLTAGGDAVTGPAVAQVGAVTNILWDATASAALNTGTKLAKTYTWSLGVTIDGDGPHQVLARQITVHPVGYAGTTAQGSDVTATITVGGADITVEVTVGGSGGTTDITWTASPTGATIASSTGADGTATLADGTNAGLMSPAGYTAVSTLAATYQPLDSDLTAIAALTTTSYGRAFLALADAAAGRTALGLGTAATTASTAYDAAGLAAAAQAASQPLDSDLTAIAALTTTSYGRAFLALADAAAGRTALGLGTAATTAASAYEVAGAAAAAQAASQPLDSDLTSIAALATTSFGRSVLALADASALRTLAGSVIGTDVEAHDTDLTTFAGLSPSNDDVLQRKAGAWTNRTIAQLLTDLGIAAAYQPLDSDLTAIAALTTTSIGRSLLASADAAAIRTIAGAVIGTNVQAFDAELTAIAGLTSAADKVPYFTGSGTAAVADLSTFARTVIDDTTASAARDTLGVGAIGAICSGRPTGYIAQNMSRMYPGLTGQSVLTSGKEHYCLIELPAGVTVTSITFHAGSQALVAGTNQWFALRSSARGLLGITSDDTSTAWSASTPKTLNLATPYVVPATGFFYLTIMVAAGTVVNLYGGVFQTQLNTIPPITNGADGTNTGLTTPATAPSTGAALSVASNAPWCGCS